MEINNFIKKRPHLIWHTKDFKNISEQAAVEAVLNYGDWDDIQALIEIMGMEKVAKIFREKSRASKVGRQNYRKRAKNYFTLYFNKNAPL